jgi:hypothetical protein
MFFLTLLPEWLFYLLTVVGILCILLIFSIGALIPIQYKMPIVYLSICSMCFGMFMAGASNNESHWAEKVNQMEVKVAKQEVAAAELTTEVITKYVDRVKIVEGKTREIIKKVPVYITKESDDKCVINNGFVSLHNSSASNNEISNSTGSSNEESTDVKLSTIATTVSENYGTYYQVVEQLKSLQDWIKQQKDLDDGK